MTTGARRKRRMGVEERRQQLIDVALDLFSRRSPENVSIDDIAAAAGISRPLVYHYFPGKHSLYEAAVRRAAEELTGRFAEPPEGPLSGRLLRVMGRYFDFVAEHGPGFSALLRGGPAMGADPARARTSAMIDEVRATACRHVLGHLGVETPGPRLALVVRSWVGLAETTALSWLEAPRAMPREELESQLVHSFVALAAVSALHDEQTRRVLRDIVRQEPADGPLRELAVQLAALAPDR
ncbi:TetR/AcrR family transcriptional regulator [Streptomyces qinglanensis]|uniref:TetR/AcrR family transcriptional regulator n=1 Tax=Streptomyces qinglanensis TaxID=943816 RepID=UPI003D7636CF